jgi:hypothetical protein
MRSMDEEIWLSSPNLQSGVEEHAPVRVVGVGKLQGDRNVSTNVHGLDDVDDGSRSGVAAGEYSGLKSMGRGRAAEEGRIDQIHEEEARLEDTMKEG